MQHIEDLDENGGGGEHKKGRQNIKEDSWGCKKWQKSCDSHWLNGNWFKPWKGIMNGQCLTSQRRETLTSRSRFNPKKKKKSSHSTGCRMSRNSGSAFISSPIGLANKLVQFKKRPSYSCSLKAAYTKTYEKNLWYKEFQNTKNFTLTLIHPVIHS